MQWPNGFLVPEVPPIRSSYPRLEAILSGSRERARISLMQLASDQRNPTAKEDRRKYQKSLKNFANVKAVSGGPNLSELARPVTESRAVSDETTDCLRKLYTILCRFCNGTTIVNSGKYQANIGLSLLPQSSSGDGLTAHLFLLHEHKDLVDRAVEWKEAHIQVSIER